MADHLPSRSGSSRLPTIGLLRRCMAWVARLSPFILTQVAQASERYAQHHERITSIDALKEAYVLESQAVARAKEALLQKATGADSFDPIAVASKLSFIDQHMRTIGVQARALNYIESPGPASSSTPLLEHEEVPAFWLDKFRELSKLRGEDWRQDLLARALAEETACPGMISLQTLWNIGTLSVEQFHALAHFLDACLLLDAVPYFYGHIQSVQYVPVPECRAGGVATYGDLVILLVESGLTHTPSTTGGPLDSVPADTVCTLRYVDKTVSFTTKAVVDLQGVKLTRVGKELARLYQPRSTPLGSKLYDDCVRLFHDLKAVEAPPTAMG